MVNKPSPSILAIIPARGGSKGLPRKNILHLNNKPLLHYTIEAAKKSKYITTTIVSTDDPEIKKQAEAANALVPFIRPPHLATDTATTIDVVKHAILFFAEQNKTFDSILVLQPTSPLRTTEHIDAAIEHYLQHKEANQISLVSVYKLAAKYNWCLFEQSNGFVHMHQIEKTSPRQSLGNVFMPNGAIFIISPTNIEKGFYHEKTIIFEMPEELSIDIDLQEDLLRAESILNNRQTI